jgi:predicted NBD/HSP70 family sugar kinase
MASPRRTGLKSSRIRNYSVRRIDLSSAQRASNENARDINRDIVLELIRFRQPLSRVELARLSGLQPSTVSDIVEQLLGEGWICEGAIVRPPRGRPSTMLQVSDRLVTFAIDIRPDRAIVAVIDLAGRFLSRETVMIVADADEFLRRLVRAMRTLQRKHADKTFEGIGVSVPGRVQPETQQILLAPNLHWQQKDIRRVLERSFKVQVELENDANSCLLAESWYGRLEGVRNAVLVAVSEGIGAAILSEGQIHSGFNGMAGEFGHISMDPNGPRCGCGGRGCWEMLAASPAALRAYRTANRRTGSKVRAKDIYSLLRLADEEDTAAIAAITQQAKALGRGLRLIMATISPEVILITGELTSSWQRFGPIVQAEMEAGVLAGSAPHLTTAGDGADARLLGAAAVLMQRHFGYHRSTHVLKAKSRLPVDALGREVAKSNLTPVASSR